MASWGAPTLVNDDQTSGPITETGTAASGNKSVGERQPGKQVETTAKGSSRGVGSLFSKAKSFFGEK